MVCRRLMAIRVWGCARRTQGSSSHPGDWLGREPGAARGQPDGSHRARSAWIPGSSASPLSETGHAFFSPWHKKSCKEDRVPTRRVDDLGTSTPLECHKSVVTW